MTTMKQKLEQKEKQAEELHAQIYTDTALEKPVDDPADIKQEDLIVADDKSDLPADNSAQLEEENRRLNEALKALQGKYNAEVPRLTQKLRETQEELDTAKKAKVAAEDSAAQANKELEQHIESLRESYGDDIADVLKRIASNKKQDTDKPIVKENNDGVERFFRVLRRNIASFDEINQSPEFIQWLQTTSPNGLSFQQLLNEAGADLDVVTVTDIFSLFKQEKAEPEKNKPGKAEDFAAPPRGKPSPPEKKKQYTTNDWVQLQEDIRRGRYRGRESEAAALEREIHAAIHGY